LEKIKKGNKLVEGLIKMRLQHIWKATSGRKRKAAPPLLKITSEYKVGTASLEINFNAYIIKLSLKR
jgi:hypothetical protein